MNKENKKIFFTDLDGTLLNDQKEISKENYECIQDWVAAGHLAVLCTGRSISSAIRQAKALNLTMRGCYIISFNGALIYDTYEEKIIYRRKLPEDYLPLLFKTADELNIHIQAYDDQYVYCKKENDAIKRYCFNTKMEYRIDTELPYSLKGDVPKLLLIDFEHKQPLFDYIEKIKDWNSSKVDTFFSCDQYLEIVPPGVNKGTAVLWLCDYLGIPIENSISAGDAENDIEMLKVTKVSIVMNNADPSMYPYATHITRLDNNHSGIADMLRSFF